jgi:hypothetical protein
MINSGRDASESVHIKIRYSSETVATCRCEGDGGINRETRRKEEEEVAIDKI